jgi:hypothetical protein
LRAAVAGIGAGSGEGDSVHGFEFTRGFGNESPDLPVAGVEAESDGGAVFGAKAAMGAEDEDLGTKETRGIPSHAGVLAEAEEIAGRLSEKHLWRDGKNAGWAGGVCGDGSEIEFGGFEYGDEGDFRNGECSC